MFYVAVSEDFPMDTFENFQSLPAGKSVEKIHLFVTAHRSCLQTSASTVGSKYFPIILCPDLLTHHNLNQLQ